MSENGSKISENLPWKKIVQISDIKNLFSPKNPEFKLFGPERMKNFEREIFQKFSAIC